MTHKTIDWLNANRFRAYPLVEGPGLVAGGRIVPSCVLLDCLVFDTRPIDHVPEMEFTGFDVEEGRTVVSFSYDGMEAEYSISGDYPSGFVSVKSSGAGGAPNQAFDIKLVFSEHKYILDHVGIGSWRFRGRVMPSNVVSVRASGVSGLSVGGSSHVGPSGTARGIVVLEDGFRTMPTVRNGNVVVRVGRKYGLDPCSYDGRKSVPDAKCDDHLLFFCGQNAVDSGNVVLRGGPGVSVSQGRKYTSPVDIPDSYGNVGIRAGESVPCIEISATSALLGIYSPSVPDPSPARSSSSCSSETSGNSGADGV